MDALSFGFVKNGAMSAEALVFFKPGLADATRRRRKRAGLLMSKGRYLAAQVLAMVENDLWIANGALANACAERLAEAAGERLVYPVEANEVFLRATPEEAARLRAQGFDFYDWAEGNPPRHRLGHRRTPCRAPRRRDRRPGYDHDMSEFDTGPARPAPPS